MRKVATVALMYDFDKTLCDQDMQNYSFIPNLNMSSDEFWQETMKFGQKNYMEGILAYMYYMYYKCKEKNVPFTKEYLRSLGTSVNFYKGVTNWFQRINAYGESLGIKVEHYIISSGIKDIIEGSEIKDEFKKIFACQYYFDNEGNVVWPSITINYTQKTQYIFRISKGTFDETDTQKVNAKMSDRPIPYQNMIYIGDGLTDVPCMTFLKKQGGTSIAIFPRGKKNKVTDLLLDERVNYIAQADYQEGSDLDTLVKLIMQNIAINHKLLMKQRTQRKREANKHSKE